MITPIKYSPCRRITFGTTQRRTDTIIHPEGHEIYNASCFVRGESDSPERISKYLINRASQVQDVEWKIWGCSDMSQFLTRRIIMQKELGKDNFRRKFNDIELIDIDPKIAERNKKGLIGIAEFDKRKLKHGFNIELDDYFEKTKNKDDFFLKGEPRIADGYEIEPHKIAPELLDNVKIRTGDIRRELRDLSNAKPSTLRIFDFANAWYCLGKDEQIDLALNFEKKLKLGDILMIGRVERARNVHKVLEMLGFEGAQTRWGQMQTTLAKARQLSSQQFEFIGQKLLKEGRQIID